MRILYRARQFWHALRASLTEEELAQVREVLSPPLLALFLRMQPSEQAHSFRVFQQLIEQGDPPPELLTAALLHDVGKSRLPLSLWERVVIVVGEKLFPEQVYRWGQDQQNSFRPFVVARQHADWGAQMAEQAGAHPLTVALIRRHQEPLSNPFPDERQPVDYREFEDQLLNQLQWVDNES